MTHCSRTRAVIIISRNHGWLMLRSWRKRWKTCFLEVASRSVLISFGLSEADERWVYEEETDLCFCGLWRTRLFTDGPAVWDHRETSSHECRAPWVLNSLWRSTRKNHMHESQIQPRFRQNSISITGHQLSINLKVQYGIFNGICQECKKLKFIEWLEAAAKRPDTTNTSSKGHMWCNKIGLDALFVFPFF